MKKVTILLVILLLCSIAYAAEDVQQLELKVEKIKDDLNKDPKLFQDYAKAKFGVGAKMDLVGGAKLENGMLVHPKGAKLDLSTLQRLSGLTGVTMLADGQFKFSFANSEIKASGVEKIQATDKGLLLDGVEVRTSGKLDVRKTSEGYSLIGSGTIVAGGKTFDIKTSGTKAALLDYRAGKAYSISMPADEKGGSSIGYNKHTLTPLKESLTLYMDKADYDSSKGNKAFIGEKVYLSNAGGKVAVDGYYMFTDGKVAMIRGAKGTAPLVSYTYKGSAVALQSTVDLASAKKYQSISQLFKDNGYGEGSKNYAAREALYKQYFGEGYKGYSQQNQKLLAAIQNGDIPLLAKGDMTYETMPTGVTETVKDVAGQTVRQASVGVREAQSAASSLDYTSPGQQRYQTVINQLRRKGVSEEVINGAFGEFRLPEERKVNPPTDLSKFEVREGTGTFFGAIVKNDPANYAAESKKYGFSPSKEGTDVNLAAERKYWVGQTASGQAPLFGSIAVHETLFADLKSQGITHVYMEYNDRPEKNGWYGLTDSGSGPKGYVADRSDTSKNEWADIYGGAGAKTYVNTIKNYWGGEAKQTFKMYIPNDKRVIPKFSTLKV